MNEQVWGVTLWEGGRGGVLTICESQGESDKEVTMGSRARKIFPQHVNGGGGALGVCFYTFSLTIFSLSLSPSLSLSLGFAHASKLLPLKSQRSAVKYCLYTTHCRILGPIYSL